VTPPITRLVIVAPNWLGDAVMALPAIADVRRDLPHSDITVAARPAIAPLFGMVAGVNHVIDAARLDDRFDTALLLPNSFRSALLAKRAGIRERWGYRTQWRAPLLTRGIAPPRAVRHVHQADYYQRLVRALGFANGPVESRLAVPPEAREAGARALREAGWDGAAPLVALAPGAAYGGAKRWPPEQFAELAQMLARDGVTCVMVGTSADATTAADVAQAYQAPEAGRALCTLVGHTDLPALAGVLAHCRTLVTNDSGAMHLAAAIGIAVTAVFGPTDERATRPLGGATTVVTNPVWCRPCLLRECPIDHQCMRGIEAADVMAATRRTHE
jgi:heptosyltransferase-2